MIDKSNIEHWLFKYHEGLLAEKDKTALFDFLTDHPEFYEEFAFWANTKLSPDPNLVDFELENSLLRPMPKARNTSKHKWNTATICIGMFMTFSIFFLCKSDDKRSLLAVSVPQVGAIQDNTPPRVKIFQPTDPRQVPSTKLQVAPAPAQVPHIVGFGILDKPAVEASQTVVDTLAQTKDLVAMPDTIPTALLKSDTAQVAPASVKKESPNSVVQQKKKKKTKISFTPSEKFIKDNSDF